MANKTWTKLTKKQKAHLKEMKITSKMLFIETRKHQHQIESQGFGIACRECDKIAHDLGLE